MAKDYLQSSVAEFLGDAAAARPTPGGGSTAALAGALGVSMARMTANYTLKSAKSGSDRDKLVELEQRLTRCQQMLTQLITEDMVAYETYVAANKIDKTDPTRPEQIRSATVACMTVPAEIITTCLAGLELMDQLKNLAKHIMLSDLGVAAELSEAAANAVAWNLRSNAAASPDSSDADPLLSDMAGWLRKCLAHRRSITKYLADQM